MILALLTLLYTPAFGADVQYTQKFFCSYIYTLYIDDILARLYGESVLLVSSPCDFVSDGNVSMA